MRLIYEALDGSVHVRLGSSAVHRRPNAHLRVLPYWCRAVRYFREERCPPPGYLPLAADKKQPAPHLAVYKILLYLYIRVTVHNILRHYITLPSQQCVPYFSRCWACTRRAGCRGADFQGLETRQFLTPNTARRGSMNLTGAVEHSSPDGSMLPTIQYGAKSIYTGPCSNIINECCFTHRIMSTTSTYNSQCHEALN
jgi:hypothetical protein